MGPHNTPVDNYHSPSMAQSQTLPPRYRASRPFPRHYHSPSTEHSLPSPLATMPVPSPLATVPVSSPHARPPLPLRKHYPSPSQALPFPHSSSPVTITPPPRSVLSPSPSLACPSSPPRTPSTPLPRRYHSLTVTITPLPPPEHSPSPSLSLPSLWRSFPFPLTRVQVPPPCAPSPSLVTITPPPRSVLSPSPSLACPSPPPHARPLHPRRWQSPSSMLALPFPLASTPPPRSKHSPFPLVLVDLSVTPPTASLHQRGANADVGQLLELEPRSGASFTYKFKTYHINEHGKVVPDDGFGHGGDRRGPAYREFLASGRVADDEGGELEETIVEGEEGEEASEGIARLSEPHPFSGRGTSSCAAPRDDSVMSPTAERGGASTRTAPLPVSPTAVGGGATTTRAVAHDETHVRYVGSLLRLAADARRSYILTQGSGMPT
ncbi:unnamed protein product [Closterium sp. Naga37s-1]|nr:unnamed protein product [Closterium sp. Naga37s-1]